MEEFLKIAKNPALWPEGQNPNILLIAPPPIGDQIANSYFYGMFDEKSVALSKQFGDLYARVAKANGCHFLDAGLYAQSDDTGDSIHFSPESHAKLGAAVAEKIKEIFK